MIIWRENLDEVVAVTSAKALVNPQASISCADYVGDSQNTNTVITTSLTATIHPTQAYPYQGNLTSVFDWIKFHEITV